MTSLPHLLLYVQPEMREIYEKHVEIHNNKVDTDPYANSGFDLLIPNNVDLSRNEYQSTMVDLLCRGEMTYNDKPSAYYVFLRSSVSKTPLMLANHTGVIDSGYRGNLKIALRCFNEKYTIEKNTSVVQICHPSLLPIKVKLVDNSSDLSDTTRGNGGFGSTGLI